MPRYDIEKLLKKSFRKMIKGLNTYYPQRTEWDLQEANIAIHVGHQLLANKFVVLPEARLKDPGKRLDMLALRPSQGHQDPMRILAVEFKRIWSARSGGELVKDARRLKASRWERRIPGTAGAAIGRLLIGVTHRPDVVSWWKGELEGMPFRSSIDQYHEDWRQLGRLLGAARKETFEDTIKVDGVEKPIALVYALWTNTRW